MIYDKEKENLWEDVVLVKKIGESDDEERSFDKEKV